MLPIEFYQSLLMWPAVVLDYAAYGFAGGWARAAWIHDLLQHLRSLLAAHP
jgi:hypothetical protein